MQSKRFIWTLVATLVTAAVAGCATPEETTDEDPANNTTTGDGADGTMPGNDTTTGNGTGTNDTGTNDTDEIPSEPAGESPGEHEVIDDNKTLSEEVNGTAEDDNGTVMADG